VNRSVAFLGGVGLGSALMYLLDPDAGSRRRAVARNKAVSTWHDSRELARKAARDARHRATGAVARGRSVWSRGDFVPDEKLVERVRSKLGRVVSHPRAVLVEVSDGLVTLAGDIFADEARRAVRAVKHVRGVREVEDQLQPHEDAEGVPSLQGGRTRSGERHEIFQKNWSPSTQLIVGALGGLLAAYFLVSRRPVLAASGLVGTGYLLRSKRRDGSRLEQMAEN